MVQSYIQGMSSREDVWETEAGWVKGYIWYFFWIWRRGKFFILLNNPFSWKTNHSFHLFPLLVARQNLQIQFSKQFQKTTFVKIYLTKSFRFVNSRKFISRNFFDLSIRENLSRGFREFSDSRKFLSRKFLRLKYLF